MSAYMSFFSEKILFAFLCTIIYIENNWLSLFPAQLRPLCTESAALTLCESSIR